MINLGEENEKSTNMDRGSNKYESTRLVLALNEISDKTNFF